MARKKLKFSDDKTERLQTQAEQNKIQMTKRQYAKLTEKPFRLTTRATQEQATHLLNRVYAGDLKSVSFDGVKARIRLYNQDVFYICGYITGGNTDEGGINFHKLVRDNSTDYGVLVWIYDLMRKQVKELSPQKLLEIL